ncbi:MAG TPA: cyclic nucleotide-binding domain-containing protein, partial [Chloroflexia bacterium]|nr:cyclic nucleotide-binding domain-containing protein [Chloroflexia bacterium]
FAGLDFANLLALAAALQTERFPAGVDVVRQGEAGDKLYIIQGGAAAVLIAAGEGELEIDQMVDGEYFGETALFSGGIRTATVRTTEPTECYSLTYARFAALLEQVPAIQAGVQAALYTHWANHLRAIPLFAGLTEAARQELVADLHWESYGAGSTIMRQGEDGAALYIIQRGAVEVLVRTDQGEQVVLLGADDYFGEIALLGNGIRTATVRAIHPTELYRLEGATVLALLDREPDLRASLLATLAQRTAGRPGLVV